MRIVSLGLKTLRLFFSKCGYPGLRLPFKRNELRMKEIKNCFLHGGACRFEAPDQVNLVGRLIDRTFEKNRKYRYDTMLSHPKIKFLGQGVVQDGFTVCRRVIVENQGLFFQ